MAAKISDQDVQLYLDELKGFVFSFGDVTDTGTENLVELLNFILDDVDNIKYSSIDKRELLSARYSKISAQLDTYTALYQDSLIEERYTKYKDDNKNISVDSPYMYNIVRQLDLTMKDKITNLSDVRYEKSFLLVNINNLNDIITNADTLTADINELISKCEST
jgi:hypothetical protein